MLEGRRVLDLTRVLAGPLSTMMLGDLGADVIKVERPRVGDDTRAWGPPFDVRGESAYYLSINRNKLDIALDLDLPADQEVLAGLIAGADVVVDNYKRGTLERRGIVPENWLERCPSLVWCTLTGFGQESNRPGYDFVVQAERGWMSITGDADGDPMKAGVALADVIAGKDTAIAILAALAARAPLGVDQRRIFTSLAHSATAALVNVAQNTLVSGEDAKRWGNGHPNLVPYQLFQAHDRPLVIAVGNDAQWQACCTGLMLTELGVDPELVTNAGRVLHRSRVVGAIAARTAERNAAEWVSALDALGVPCGLVRTVREALTDVPVSAITGVGPAVSGAIRFPPPRLDEHGALIRRSGWGAFQEVAS